MFFSALRIPLLVSILFSPISTFARNDNSSPLQGIFPPLTPFINYGNLIIAYESSGFTLHGSINSGVEAIPNETSIAPNISIAPFEGHGNPFLPINTTQLYTLVMIDPDAPSRANPTVAQILHFVQTGLKITSDPGETTESTYLGLTTTVPPMVPYLAPAPPVDTGLHRYIFLLFMQPDDNVDLGSFSADNRRNFDVQSFMKNNTFGPPVAGAYFQEQNAANSVDITVPEGDTTSNDLIINEPDVNDPLVIDTSIPTPPARLTGIRYLTVVRSDIVYEGTLTYSSPPITEEVEGPITVSVEVPGQIGDWTMTAPGDMGEQIIVTSTTEAPVPTSEMATSSVPTLRGSSDSSSTSIVGVQQAGTEKPSASTGLPRLDGSILDNSAVGKSAGVTMFMGVLAGGVIYLTFIL